MLMWTAASIAFSVIIESPPVMWLATYVPVFHSEANELRRMGYGGVPRRRVAHGHHSHLGRHPVEIRDSSPYRGVAQGSAQGGSNGDLRGRLRGKRRRRGVQKDFVDRRQLAKQPNESDKFRSRCQTHRSIQELRLKLAGPREKLRLLTTGDTAKHL